jgi:hypothetical protein
MFALGADTHAAEIKIDDEMAYLPYPGEAVFRARPLVRISGAIEQGDEITVVSFLNDLRERISREHDHTADPLRPAAPIVSLDSPGGNLDAAIAIADYLRSTNIGTIVEADAECYSACAIIFMSGRSYYQQFGFVFSGRERYLEIPGRVGFHSPALPCIVGPRIESNASIRGSEFNEIVSELVEGIYGAHEEAGQLIVALLEGNPEDFHQRLILEMLSFTGSREDACGSESRVSANNSREHRFAMIDTIADAVDWEINVLNLRPRVKSADEFRQALYWICLNSKDPWHREYMGFDDWVDDAETEALLDAARRSVRFNTDGTVSVVLHNGGCQFEDGNFSLDVQSTLAQLPSYDPWIFSWLYSYPRSALLEDLELGGYNFRERSGHENPLNTFAHEDVRALPFFSVPQGPAYHFHRNRNGFVVELRQDDDNVPRSYRGRTIYLGISCDTRIEDIVGTWSFDGNLVSVELTSQLFSIQPASSVVIDFCD